jgi:hypothetical protein
LSPCLQRSNVETDDEDGPFVVPGDRLQSGTAAGIDA